MKKLLIHLGMGGHTSQVLRLVELMENKESKNKYNYEYLIGLDDQTSVQKIKYFGSVHKVKNPRLMTDKSVLKVFLKMFPTTLQVFKLLRKIKPNVIISAGPSLTIPLFWIAKLLGIKTIFVESWVRVHHGSQAGRFCYPVSDLFLVQWPTMKKVYPKAIYAGRLS
ncbi:MAG: PssD/Cps14F family polysaccharide biosynthesis glycosyltransferase [Candidatus Woesearchaeota archaeon]